MSSGAIVSYILCSIACLAFIIVVLRLTFSVSQFLSIQRKQLKLLEEIAKANNVSPDVIDGIDKAN